MTLSVRPVQDGWSGDTWHEVTQNGSGTGIKFETVQAANDYIKDKEKK